jgi:hypothetical protein
VRRGLAGIEPTPARPNGARYARLNLSATAGIYIYIYNVCLLYVIYNGEPIMEFRLKYLNDYVDHFIIAESIYIPRISSVSIGTC